MSFLTTLTAPILYHISLPMDGVRFQKKNVFSFAAKTADIKRMLLPTTTHTKKKRPIIRHKDIKGINIGHLGKGVFLP